MANENAVLEKLLKQETELKQKIREARKQDDKRKAVIQENRANIIGRAVIAEMAQDEQLAKTINPIIDKHTTSARNRVLVGLRPHTKPETVPENKDKFSVNIDEKKNK